MAKNEGHAFHTGLDSKAPALSGETATFSLEFISGVLLEAADCAQCQVLLISACGVCLS